MKSAVSSPVSSRASSLSTSDNSPCRRTATPLSVSWGSAYVNSANRLTHLISLATVIVVTGIIQLNTTPHQAPGSCGNHITGVTQQEAHDPPIATVDDDGDRTEPSVATSPRVVGPPPPSIKSLTQPSGNPTAQYTEVIHSRCRCKEPFTDEYETAMTSASTPPTNESEQGAPANAKKLPFWNPDVYGAKTLLRRFLKKWFSDVLAFREKKNVTSAASTTDTAVPEARLLVIGDSLNRNMFMSMVLQAVDEGLHEKDAFSSFVHNAVRANRDMYQYMYVTWPSKSNSSSKSPPPGDQLVARIKIRLESQVYFGMDTHSLKSSGGLEFNPTHVFINRGLWDLLHGEPHDPSVMLSSLSAGLVRLRKELSDHREQLSHEERELYPPPRVVFMALPKIFKSTDEFIKLRGRHVCLHDRDQSFYRDALFAAVRRANGGLLHQHGTARFAEVAIEWFDYYAMSMVAGPGNTWRGDGKHPTPRLRAAILAQMLDLVSQPPKPQNDVTSLIDIKSGVFSNATLHIPTPLLIEKANRSQSSPLSRSCPLWFSTTELQRVLQPPLVNATNRENGAPSQIHDVTPPLVADSVKVIFLSNMQCLAALPVDWASLTKVEVAFSWVAQHKEWPYHNASTEPKVEQQVVTVPWLLTNCARLLDAYLSRYRTLLPVYLPPSAPRPLKNATLKEKALWNGNRCVRFIDQEIVASGGPSSFYSQLWNFTDARKIICATPPRILWLTRQPVLKVLASECGDDADRLAHCAARHGVVRTPRPSHKKKK